MRSLSLYFVLLVFAAGCASTKQLSPDIDAYEQTIMLAHKLKHSPNNQHLWRHINQSYPQAAAWFEAEMESGNQSSQSKLTWINNYSLMMRVNAMSDSIIAIPGWEQHIAGLKIYTAELDSAKVKAVNECIQQAQFLNKYNNMSTLRIALFYLDQADALVPDNAVAEELRKEISDKIKSLPTKE